MSSPINHGFNLPPQFSIYQDSRTYIPGILYDKAKALFIENKGTISTKELREKFEITPEQANAIMDMLKADIRPEIISQWKDQ